MTFGEIIKQLLQLNNLSQADLAKEIGFSQRAVSKWINSQAEPTATAIINCAKFFHVSAGYLLGLEN